MNRWLSSAGLCCALALLPAVVLAQAASPQPLNAAGTHAAVTDVTVTHAAVTDVTVTDVAGGQAYLSAGEAAGLRRGDRVSIGGAKYTVVAVARDSATIAVGDTSLAVGAHGRATTSPGTHDVVEQRLPAPADLAHYHEQWPDATRPASTQHPEHVALGKTTGQGRVNALLSLTNADVITSASVISRTELRGRVSYEPWSTVPLRFDADAAGAGWVGMDARAGTGSRPNLRVYQLQASYGDRARWFAAAGRLRYAAQALGPLDGVRAQAPLAQNFTVGAFGGFAPNPIDGKPGTDSTRFGTELRWDAPERALRPALAFTAYGSQFAGSLDERRMIATADVFPGEHHVGGYAEVSLFDKNNPWGAPRAELSAAGAESTVRFDPWQLGVRVDMQRPERTRWLATLLPAGWFCNPKPAPGSPLTEPCTDNEARYLATTDATFRRGRFSAALTALGSTTQHGTASNAGAIAQARFVRIVQSLHADASVSSNFGSLVRSYGLGAGLGSGFWHDRIDVTLRYRPTLLHYDAGGGTLLEHSIAADFAVLPCDELQLDAQAEALTGKDRGALLIFGMLSWHPNR